MAPNSEREKMQNRADQLTALESVRAMPHNIEVEQAVLGAMFLDRDAVNLAVENLLPEYFYKKAMNMFFGPW